MSFNYSKNLFYLQISFTDPSLYCQIYWPNQQNPSYPQNKQSNSHHISSWLNCCNYRESLFELLPSASFQVNEEINQKIVNFQKRVSGGGDTDSLSSSINGSTYNEHAPTQSDLARAKTQQEQFKAQIKEKNKRGVSFGDRVVLKHHDSGSYLCALHECAPTLTGAFVIELTPLLSEKIVFKLEPYRTYEKVGEQIRVGAPVRIFHEGVQGYLSFADLEEQQPIAKSIVTKQEYKMQLEQEEREGEVPFHHLNHTELPKLKPVKHFTNVIPGFAPSQNAPSSFLSLGSVESSMSPLLTPIYSPRLLVINENTPRRVFSFVMHQQSQGLDSEENKMRKSRNTLNQQSDPFPTDSRRIKAEKTQQQTRGVNQDGQNFNNSNQQSSQLLNSSKIGNHQLVFFVHTKNGKYLCPDNDHQGVQLKKRRQDVSNTLEKKAASDSSFQTLSESGSISLYSALWEIQQYPPKPIMHQTSLEEVQQRNMLKVPEIQLDSEQVFLPLASQENLNSRYLHTTQSPPKQANQTQQNNYLGQSNLMLPSRHLKPPATLRPIHELTPALQQGDPMRLNNLNSGTRTPFYQTLSPASAVSSYNQIDLEASVTQTFGNGPNQPRPPFGTERSGINQSVNWLIETSQQSGAHLGLSQQYESRFNNQQSAQADLQGNSRNQSGQSKKRKQRFIIRHLASGLTLWLSQDQPEFKNSGRNQEERILSPQLVNGSTLRPNHRPILMSASSLQDNSLVDLKHKEPGERGYGYFLIIDPKKGQEDSETHETSTQKSSTFQIKKQYESHFECQPLCLSQEPSQHSFRIKKIDRNAKKMALFVLSAAQLLLKFGRIMNKFASCKKIITSSLLNKVINVLKGLIGFIYNCDYSMVRNAGNTPNPQKQLAFDELGIIDLCTYTTQVLHQQEDAVSQALAASSQYKKLRKIYALSYQVLESAADGNHIIKLKVSLYLPFYLEQVVIQSNKIVYKSIEGILEGNLLALEVGISNQYIKRFVSNLSVSHPDPADLMFLSKLCVCGDKTITNNQNSVFEHFYQAGDALQQKDDVAFNKFRFREDQGKIQILSRASSLSQPNYRTLSQLYEECSSPDSRSNQWKYLMSYLNLLAEVCMQRNNKPLEFIKQALPLRMLISLLEQPIVSKKMLFQPFIRLIHHAYVETSTYEEINRITKVKEWQGLGRNLELPTVSQSLPVELKKLKELLFQYLGRIKSGFHSKASGEIDTESRVDFQGLFPSVQNHLHPINTKIEHNSIELDPDDTSTLFTIRSLLALLKATFKLGFWDDMKQIALAVVPCLIRILRFDLQYAWKRWQSSQDRSTLLRKHSSLNLSSSRENIKMKQVTPNFIASLKTELTLPKPPLLLLISCKEYAASILNIILDFQDNVRVELITKYFRDVMEGDVELKGIQSGRKQDYLKEEDVWREKVEEIIHSRNLFQACKNESEFKSTTLNNQLASSFGYESFQFMKELILFETLVYSNSSLAALTLTLLDRLTSQRRRILRTFEEIIFVAGGKLSELAKRGVKTTRSSLLQLLRPEVTRSKFEDLWKTLGDPKKRNQNEGKNKRGRRDASLIRHSSGDPGFQMGPIQELAYLTMAMIKDSSPDPVAAADFYKDTDLFPFEQIQQDPSSKGAPQGLGSYLILTEKQETIPLNQSLIKSQDHHTLVLGFLRLMSSPNMEYYMPLRALHAAYNFLTVLVHEHPQNKKQLQSSLPLVTRHLGVNVGCIEFVKQMYHFNQALVLKRDITEIVTQIISRANTTALRSSLKAQLLDFIRVVVLFDGKGVEKNQNIVMEIISQFQVSSNNQLVYLTHAHDSNELSRAIQANYDQWIYEFDISYGQSLKRFTKVKLPSQLAYLATFFDAFTALIVDQNLVNIGKCSNMHPHGALLQLQCNGGVSAQLLLCSEDQKAQQIIQKYCLYVYTSPWFFYKIQYSLILLQFFSSFNSPALILLPQFLWLNYNLQSYIARSHCCWPVIYHLRAYINMLYYFPNREQDTALLEAFTGRVGMDGCRISSMNLKWILNNSLFNISLNSQITFSQKNPLKCYYNLEIDLLNIRNQFKGIVETICNCLDYNTIKIENPVRYSYIGSYMFLALFEAIRSLLFVLSNKNAHTHLSVQLSAWSNGANLGQNQTNSKKSPLKQANSTKQNRQPLHHIFLEIIEMTEYLMKTVDGRDINRELSKVSEILKQYVSSTPLALVESFIKWSKQEAQKNAINYPSVNDDVPILRKNYRFSGKKSFWRHIIDWNSFKQQAVQRDKAYAAVQKGVSVEGGESKEAEKQKHRDYQLECIYLGNIEKRISQGSPSARNLIMNSSNMQAIVPTEIDNKPPHNLTTSLSTRFRVKNQRFISDDHKNQLINARRQMLVQFVSESKELAIYQYAERETYLHSVFYYLDDFSKSLYDTNFSIVGSSDVVRALVKMNQTERQSLCEAHKQMIVGCVISFVLHLWKDSPGTKNVNPQASEKKAHKNLPDLTMYASRTPEPQKLQKLHTCLLDCQCPTFLCSLLRWDVTASSMSMIQSCLMLGIGLLMGGNTRAQAQIMRQVESGGALGMWVEVAKVIRRCINAVEAWIQAVQADSESTVTRKNSSTHQKVIRRYASQDYFDDNQKVLIIKYKHIPSTKAEELEILEMLNVVRLAFCFLRLLCLNNSTIKQILGGGVSKSQGNLNISGDTSIGNSSVSVNFIELAVRSFKMLSEVPFPLLFSNKSLYFEIMAFIQEVTQIPCIDNQLYLCSSSYFKDQSTFFNKIRKGLFRDNFQIQEVRDKIDAVSILISQTVQNVVSLLQGNHRGIYQCLAEEQLLRFYWDAFCFQVRAWQAIEGKVIKLNEEGVELLKQQLMQVPTFSGAILRLFDTATTLVKLQHGLRHSFGRQISVADSFQTDKSFYPYFRVLASRLVGIEVKLQPHPKSLESQTIFFPQFTVFKSLSRATREQIMEQIDRSTQRDKIVGLFQTYPTIAEQTEYNFQMSKFKINGFQIPVSQKSLNLLNKISLFVAALICLVYVSSVEVEVDHASQEQLYYQMTPIVNLTVKILSLVQLCFAIGYGALWFKLHRVLALKKYRQDTQEDPGGFLTVRFPYLQSLLCLYRYKKQFLSVALLLTGSALGFMDSPKAYSLLLLNLLMLWMNELSAIFHAISINFRLLMMLSLLGSAFLTIFAVFSLPFYASGLYPQGDKSLQAVPSIPRSIMKLLLSQQVGNELSKFDLGRFLFDLSYNIFFNMLFTNIVSGVLIDTFAELRDHSKANMQDKLGKCFICGITHTQLQKQNQSLKSHYQNQYHKLWNYLFYRYYLDRTQSTGQLAGLGRIVLERILAQDVSWLPVAEENQEDQQQLANRIKIIRQKILSINH